MSLFAEMVILVPSLEQRTVPSEPMGVGGSFSGKKKKTKQKKHHLDFELPNSMNNKYAEEMKCSQGTILFYYLITRKIRPGSYKYSYIAT